LKIAFFDCAFGASGDMLLGSLIGLGLPEREWEAELNKIALPAGSFQIKITDVTRCSLAAKKVDVLMQPEDHNHHWHDHHHDHAHEHEHPHAEHHDHALDHHHEQERHLSEILDIIKNSRIDERAKELASKVFHRLAEAEAKVHGVTPNEVHFHEVGAIDAIVDIVGFAIGYAMLGIEHAVVSPLPIGSGLIKTQHGLFPVPGPATALIIQNAKAPIAGSRFKHECLTPTGAAILATIAGEWSQAPQMDCIDAIGYGAGTFNPAEFPNVLRVMLGQRPGAGGGLKSFSDERFQSEIVAVLEANLDDFSPQALSYTQEKLFEEGALDVSVSPAVMKKGRSGQLLTIVCKPEHRKRLQELVLKETSTLGVRSHLLERLVAEREWNEVELDGVKVRVKIARDRLGAVVNAQPEYEDCASYATEHGVPLKEVMAQALAQWRQRSTSH
jgi:uncharacterized protein (TIGR00299 family) protein